ncbi:MAG: prepilin-type N-terminal cleavage/methylation domain-containing protein [Acidobacteria bacterium]|nr:prepilin-type N-terminal cleavage/methylation domain-containing protein [Acidobacteriota bacterium]
MKNKTKTEPLCPHSGFSFVELLIVIALVCILGGFAVVGIRSAQTGMYANKSMHQVVDQLRRGRQLAVGNRRAVEIRFPTDDTFQLVQLNIPNGETVLNTLVLTNGCRFTLFGGVPDSPDFFGNSSPVDFGGVTPLVFLSDGSLIDNQGNPVNGSVFLGIAGHPETARAVTILGSTGRIRGYRWAGSQWVH